MLYYSTHHATVILVLLGAAIHGIECQDSHGGNQHPLSFDSEGCADLDTSGNNPNLNGCKTYFDQVACEGKIVQEKAIKGNKVDLTAVKSCSSKVINSSKSNAIPLKSNWIPIGVYVLLLATTLFPCL